jgi:hypothetical protein
VQIAGRDGQPINEAVFRLAEMACDGPILIMPDVHKWNFVDRTGRLIVDRDFDLADSFRNVVAVGFRARRMQAVDEHGHVLFDLPAMPLRLHLGRDGGLDLIRDQGTELEDEFVPLDAEMLVELARDPDSLNRLFKHQVCGNGVAAYWLDGK